MKLKIPLGRQTHLLKVLCVSKRSEPECPEQDLHCLPLAGTAELITEFDERFNLISLPRQFVVFFERAMSLVDVREGLRETALTLVVRAHPSINFRHQLLDLHTNIPLLEEYSMEDVQQIAREEIRRNRIIQSGVDYDNLSI